MEDFARDEKDKFAVLRIWLACDSIFIHRFESFFQFSRRFSEAGETDKGGKIET